MFGRHHQKGGHPAFGRGPFGFHGHHGRHEGGRGMRGMRGGLRRFFDHGDLRFVLLKLIADQPSHGYELIKAVEQAVGGAYSPSPGVVYPTLTHLEELGHVAATPDGGKKLYTLTPEGQAFLDANARQVEALFARMGEAAARSTVSSPRLLRAQENLKTALRLKLTGSALSETQVAAIAAILDEAAAAVEGV
jgi:DNA-binding PadR family transcriptional regulator